MRITILLTFLLLVGFIDSSPSSVNRSRRSPHTQQQSTPLQLTLRLMKSQYCIADPELDAIRFKIKFVYRNKSSEPVILYKGSNLPSRLMVARNLSEAAAKRYELNSSLTQLSSGGSKCYKGAAPTNCFVTIAAGDSYETDGDVGVFIVRDDLRTIAGAVKSGDHVLEVEVPTWPESSKRARELSTRWRSFGKLWYEPMTSVPLAFTVPKDRRALDCDRESPF